MKYIEELKPGDFFVSSFNKRFILSADFRIRDKKKYHCAVSIEDGFFSWLPEDDIVDIADLYYRDKDSNILLVKEYKDDTSEDKKLY
jgi:hypothetical protein